MPRQNCWEVQNSVDGSREARRPKSSAFAPQRPMPQRMDSTEAKKEGESVGPSAGPFAVVRFRDLAHRSSVRACRVVSTRE